jgi:hypothetical protein
MGCIKMTEIFLLECLKEFTIAETKDMILPTRIQKEDEQQAYRPAEVYLMRLDDSSAAKKKAPYIIHQFISGKTSQPQGRPATCSATVRSIFCVYSDSTEDDGALKLLNLMNRLQFALLKVGVIGKKYVLDLQAGLESFVYPEDTAPYYAGELVSTWTIPAVEREVDFIHGY